MFLAQNALSEVKRVGPPLTAVHLDGITGHTACCRVLMIATSVSGVGRGVLGCKYRVVRGILITLFKKQISHERDKET